MRIVRKTRDVGIATRLTERNARLPHSAFRGQTPDVMCFGTGDGVPDRLAAARAEARPARLETNRAQTCAVCA